MTDHKTFNMADVTDVTDLPNGDFQVQMLFVHSGIHGNYETGQAAPFIIYPFSKVWETYLDILSRPRGYRDEFFHKSAFISHAKQVFPRSQEVILHMNWRTNMLVQLIMQRLTAMGCTTFEQRRTK